METGTLWDIEQAPIDLPITPEGHAGLLELVNHPSHRFAGTQLIIAFEADPAVVRMYVPEPLELDGSGLCIVWAMDNYLYTDRHSSEFVDPRRSHFPECILKVPCRYPGRDEDYLFNVYAWTSSDWVMYLGRGAGVPHKRGQVHLTQFHPADPVYSGPREGVRACVSVEHYGQILRGYVDLKRPCEPKGMPFITDNTRMLGRRVVYDVVSKAVLMNDLCSHWADVGMKIGPVWTGEAGLTFFDAENEEILPFQPRHVVSGYWFTRQWSLGTSHGLESIHQYR
jgi:hypothetical protein